jgi:hypothetical protein
MQMGIWESERNQLEAERISNMSWGVNRTTIKDGYLL